MYQLNKIQTLGREINDAQAFELGYSQPWGATGGAASQLEEAGAAATAAPSAGGAATSHPSEATGESNI